MGDYQRAFLKAGVVVSAICLLGIVGISGTLSSIRGAAHGIWGTILWGLVACFFPAFIAMMLLIPKAVRASEAEWQGKKHHFDRSIRILGRIFYAASFAIPFCALALYWIARDGLSEPWNTVALVVFLVFLVLPGSALITGPFWGGLAGQRRADRRYPSRLR